MQGGVTVVPSIYTLFVFSLLFPCTLLVLEYCSSSLNLYLLSFRFSIRVCRDNSLLMALEIRGIIDVNEIDPGMDIYTHLYTVLASSFVPRDMSPVVLAHGTQERTPTTTMNDLY